MKRLLLLSILVLLVLPVARAQITSLSGKVVVADGGQLPDKVAIQRDCGGAPVTAGFTDRKGQFTFRWNETDAFGGDAGYGASAGGPRGPGVSGIEQPSTPRSIINSGGAAMAGCMLRASAPGYRSDPISLEGLRASFDNYDVGTIVLHRVEDTSGSQASATSMRAPSAAKKAFDKGLESLGKGKTDDAEKNFEKAVGIYPQYADAWLDLGKLRLQRNAGDAAAEALQKAVEADGKLVEAFVYLGMIDVGKKQWADAAKHLDIAVQLDPVRFPDAWFNDAVAGYNLKNYDAAEKNVREAMKLDPQRKNPQCDYLLGLILAAKKDYRGAAEQLKAYIRNSPDAPDVAKAKTQLAEIEKLQTQ